MNNEQTSTREPTEADEALGSAIGSAISAQVNAPVATPPVSLIAKRAEAQARARVVQRTMVSVAASITLLAGGLVAYNAFSDDASTDIVATDPTVVDTVVPTTSVPAIDSPTTVAPDEAPLPDDSSSSPLKWTEASMADQFGPALLDVYGVETARNGSVFARAWGDTGSQIIVSEVVGDWTRVDIPDGVSPDHVDVSGDRWLLAGQDTSQFDGPERVFYSDDRGANWTEVTIDPVPEHRSSILMALTSQQHMVVVLQIPPDRTAHDLQLRALIAAQGLVSQDTTVEGWSIQGNTVSFWTPDSADPFSFELSEQERAALDASVGDEQIRVYSSDGGTATVTGQYVSWYTTGTSNAEGFYIALTTPPDELLISSVDGVSWTETSIDNAEAFTSGLRISTRVGEWFIGRYADEIRVKSLDQLTDPGSVTATMAGMASLISLDVGPAGMVAAAYPEGPPGEPATEPLLGWSTDGTNWEWQKPSQAFGIAGDEASVDFAVGNDFVLAHMTEFKPMPDSETLEAQSPRWFIATVQ